MSQTIIPNYMAKILFEGNKNKSSKRSQYFQKKKSMLKIDYFNIYIILFKNIL